MKPPSSDAEPVGLTPPQLTVAESRLLMHHTADLPETAGTLLELGLLRPQGEHSPDRTS
jgi:hypothetical protein